MIVTDGGIEGGGHKHKWVKLGFYSVCECGAKQHDTARDFPLLKRTWNWKCPDCGKEFGSSSATPAAAKGAAQKLHRKWHSKHYAKFMAKKYSKDELLTRAWNVLRVLVERDDPLYENWPLRCLIDEIEEKLTGVTPITLL